MNTPLLVGAATRSDRLEGILDWILEENRDLEIQDACIGAFLDSDWSSTAQAINSQLDGYAGRLGVHGAYDGIYLGSGDPLVQQLAQKRLIQSLEFAEAISAKQCVVHSPFLFFGSHHACHSSCLDLEATINRVETTLTPILEKATSIGCVLVMENIFDRNPAPLRALLEKINSPYLKRSIDTGHAAITERESNGPSPEFWIREAGDLLHHLHLQDTNGEYDYHWTPGRGTLNWSGIFHAIPENETSPHMILEIKDPIAGWEHLKNEGLAI